MSLLEKGGNAFDAAAAVAFTLQVVEPQQNGLGGEAVILVHPSGASAPTVVCGQGVAPAAANIPYFRSLGLKHIPANGLLAAVVPGAFDAWMILLRDYGTKKLEDILTPAIEYAQNGAPLVLDAHQRIAKAAPLFREHWPSSAAVYLPGNSVPEAGELFRNPNLSSTYQKLLRRAADAGEDRVKQIEAARNAFYKGFVAEEVCRFSRETVANSPSGQSHCGLLDLDDMGSWEATYESPESTVFNGLRVFKAGSWTQGPAFLQALALLQDLNIFDLDPLGSAYVHTFVEAFKLAYADREAWCGDAGPNSITVADLLEEGYVAQRRQLVTANASMDLQPGSPGGQAPRMPSFETNVTGGLGEELPPITRPAKPGEGDTCHIDVIDRWGNVIAATPSGGWLNGSPIIPELGFSLSTRAQMFWLQEGLLSSLVPRTRPRTTLSPTIVLGDGRVVACGARGSDYQDQWIAQFLLNHVGFAMDLQEAWDAPKFHSDHCPRSDYPRDASPGKLTLDERFGETVLEELRSRGHMAKIQKRRRWGRGCAAKTSGGILRAAASSAIPYSLAAAR